MVFAKRPGILAIVVAAALSSPLVAEADERSDRLVDLLTSNGSYRVRAQAAFSLGRLGGDSAVAALIGALGDEHQSVRAAAALSLGRIGSRAATPSLEGIVIDPSEPIAVRVEARGALARILGQPE